MIGLRAVFPQSQRKFETQIFGVRAVKTCYL